MSTQPSLVGAFKSHITASLGLTPATQEFMGPLLKNAQNTEQQRIILLAAVFVYYQATKTDNMPDIPKETLRELPRLLEQISSKETSLTPQDQKNLDTMAAFFDHKDLKLYKALLNRKLSQTQVDVVFTILAVCLFTVFAALLGTKPDPHQYHPLVIGLAQLLFNNEVSLEVCLLLFAFATTAVIIAPSGLTAYAMHRHNQPVKNQELSDKLRPTIFGSTPASSAATSVTDSKQHTP